MLVGPFIHDELGTVYIPGRTHEEQTKYLDLINNEGGFFIIKEGCHTNQEEEIPGPVLAVGTFLHFTCYNITDLSVFFDDLFNMVNTLDRNNLELINRLYNFLPYYNDPELLLALEYINQDLYDLVDRLDQTWRDQFDRKTQRTLGQLSDFELDTLQDKLTETQELVHEYLDGYISDNKIPRLTRLLKEFVSNPIYVDVNVRDLKYPRYRNTSTNLVQLLKSDPKTFDHVIDENVDYYLDHILNILPPMALDR